MQTKTLAFHLLIGALITCCGSGCSPGQTEARKTAAELTGEDKIAADKNPQCKLFTAAELAKYVGEPLSPGHDAAMGTACQWDGRSEGDSAMIQVVAARYHEPHKHANGFKQLPDVGTQGFVEMSMGGWNAGAITGPQAVVVAVRGPAASESTAKALLTEVIKRRNK
jgi:hypothetical protein